MKDTRAYEVLICNMKLLYHRNWQTSFTSRTIANVRVIGERALHAYLHPGGSKLTAVKLHTFATARTKAKL